MIGTTLLPSESIIDTTFNMYRLQHTISTTMNKNCIPNLA